MRIVVDTNVFVSAVMSADGTSRDVLRLCFQGRLQPLMGQALFTEYEDLISREELWERSVATPKDREELLSAFFSACDWVRIFYLWRPNLIDEADNHLVELAIAGSADAIVTHNVRHLNSAELLFPHLRVLKPHQILAED